MDSKQAMPMAIVERCGQVLVVSLMAMSWSFQKVGVVTYSKGEMTCLKIS